MMAKDAVLEKVKHFSAHVAMDEQPSIVLSHGFALCGQQSMSSMADISAMSADFASTDTAGGRQHRYRQGDQKR